MPFDSAVGTQPFDIRTVNTRFGNGVVEELSSVLDCLDVDTPLIVTDAGIEESGILDRVLTPIDRTTVCHYATTEPSTDDFDDLPTESVDGVVAIGGGSCIDTAKLASVLLTHGGDAGEYVGVGTVPGPTDPLTAIPTTSGTGSQATQTAVVKHEGVKRGVSDEQLRPDVALVDPSLTFDLSRSVTSRSGFDAFVHALESLTARDYRWVPDRPITYQGANPVSRSLSAEALRLVHGSLEQAVWTGDDRESRRMLSLGSHLAGAAFSIAGLGIIHALASTVGGLRDRPHGECLAACLEPGLRYNLPVRGAEYAAIARWLGITNSHSDSEAAAAFVDECARLRDAIGLPSSIEAFGFEPDDVGTLVENTMIQQRRLITNPCDATDKLAEILAAELTE